MSQAKKSRKTSTKSRTTRASATRSAASHKTKSGGKKPRDAHGATPAGDQDVTIDRRRSPRRREDFGAVVKPAPAAPKLERRKKVNRRRQIDPTTCERDYSGDEIEFMNALDEYKRTSGRMFPTCSEVLEVVRSLGYVKISETGSGPTGAPTMPAAANANWFASNVEATEASVL